jgi:hypothetical protein
MDLRKESANQEESIFMDEWLYFFNGIRILFYKRKDKVKSSLRQKILDLIEVVMFDEKAIGQR